MDVSKGAGGVEYSLQYSSVMCRGHLSVVCKESKEANGDVQTAAGWKIIPPQTSAISTSQSEKGAEAEVDFEIYHL